MTGGLKIRFKIVYVIALIAIVSFATVSSGCTTTGSTGPSPSTGAVPTSAASQAPPASGGATKAKVAVSGDTITITGTLKGDNDKYSEPFDLKKGAYLVTVECQNSFKDNLFAGWIESADHPDDLTESLGASHATGSYCIAIAGSDHEGPHVLQVTNAGTYKVTITKPVTGDPVPVTLTCKAEGKAARAVNLNSGSVKLEVKNDAPALTSAAIYGPDGIPLTTLSTLVNKNGGSTTATVKTPGVYIVCGYFDGQSGGTVTVTQ